MDRLNLERVVEELLQEWYEFSNRDKRIQVEKIVDKSSGRYLLMQDGWIGLKRIYGPTFDIQIRDEKLWILEDNTEEGIPDELVAKGVSADQIVLGWQPEYKRDLTGFAVA